MSRDEEARPEDFPDPRTQFLPDTSRTAITFNDSPDIGFSAGLNPYRGCEHGCSYCLDGDTPILMADGTAKALRDLRVGDAIYGTRRRGWYRRYVKTTVLAHWETTQLAAKIRLEDGTRLIAGRNHRFLTERGWKFVTGAEQGRARRPYVTTRNKFMGVGQFVRAPEKNWNYMRGYLCGLIRGDGHLAFYPYERQGRSHGHQYQFRLAMVDQQALERATQFLREFGVEIHRFSFQKASATRKAMLAIRTHAKASVLSIKRTIAWPKSLSDSWCLGFLAGIFDAEGSYSGGIFRIANTDDEIILWIEKCLRRQSLRHVREISLRQQPMKYVRLLGGLREQMRFFHSVDPAISRKRDIAGQAIKSQARLRVASIEMLAEKRPLFDITTGTGDFIANGIVSHNCYARPSHEYLGLSAGIDFETKIFFKAEAPALLRKEMSSPKWEPQPISMSGITDCYQPIERKLGITRGCLEVLAEFRNPVGIITKNFLITRDIDFLAELARYRAVSVAISITTLDADLAGRLEPRASRPERRLEAIRRLHEAGVYVGVNVAPVIPGLNDHEIPAILDAAARAGARFAGHSMLQLPWAVKDLFPKWLETHEPLKKEKVLHRIREMRGGKLNDPNFFARMRGSGFYAEQIHALFRLAKKKAGIPSGFAKLSTKFFRRPGGTQLTMFGE